MQDLADNNTPIHDGSIGGRSPRDGSPLTPVPVSTAAEVEAAVARAKSAQEKWAALSPRQRAARLKQLAPLLLAQSEQIAELALLEQGKSKVETYTSELLPTVDLFKYWCKVAPRLLATQAKMLNPINFPGKSGELSLQPRGVVGLIAPWNYPLNLPLRTLVPALLAGNAVVFKPSEYAPRIGRQLVTLFEGLGFDGLVGGVWGDGDVGQALINAGVDYVVFTGSVNAGRQVAASCAARGVRCSLELGGKDPAVVLADANIDRTADGIVWGAFANAGQNCAAIERVYVVEAVAQRLIEAIVARTEKLVVGAPGVDTFDIGPLVRPAGLATVERHVQEAIAKGATLRTGGKPTGAGLHFAPTVLTDVTADMAVMREETFGPVLPISVAADEDAAISAANDCSYGLTASVWTSDLERGKRVAEKLRAGVVTINNHAFTGVVPHAPWHGLGDSGDGVTNSVYAFYDMVQPHYVLVDKSKARELWWFPHNAVMGQLAHALATLLGKGGNKLKALVEVVRLFPKRWK